MNEISSHKALDQLNTFNVKAHAETFIQIDSIEQLVEKSAEIARYQERLVLGGGSNLLFIGDYSGLVIYPQLKGVQVLKEDEYQVTLKVAASEVWHDLVCYCLKNDYFGLENLALIPGTVGAAPIQNIGAYGIEVKSFISQVECFDLQTSQFVTLSNLECQFQYRDSAIKQAGQGRYLVVSVNFVLSKQSTPVLTYKPLKEYFREQQIVSAQQVFERVCELRMQKLPDPKVLPNAGSFFKNPIIDSQHYQKLKQTFPDIIAYPVTADKLTNYKIAAGWLIEKAGFKGKVVGKVGVHKHQALVLVNYSDTDGSNLYALAQSVQQGVQQTFNIQLEAEVRILGQARIVQPRVPLPEERRSL